jgi:hypothetical protein
MLAEHGKDAEHILQALPPDCLLYICCILTEEMM